MKVTHTFRDEHGYEFAHASYDSSKRVPVGDDRTVPEKIVLQLHGGTNQPDYELKIEVRRGIPQCVELILRARPDGPEVRDKDVAVIRVADWIEQVVAECSEPRWGSFSGKPVDDRSALRDIRRVRSGRPRISRERLQVVADVYRQHFDDRPTEAVARAFGKDRRTAARYVRLARDAGLLSDTTKGKKKL